MKKKLTPQQLAAIAAGASMEAVLASNVADAGSGTGEDESSDESQAALFAVNEQLVALTADLETAKAEKADAESKLAEANAALEASNAAQASLKAAADAMTETILGRVKNMSIALNMTAPDTCEDAVALVALHADLDGKFKEKFKAGRVSATTSKTQDETKPMWSKAHLAAASKIRIY